MNPKDLYRLKINTYSNYGLVFFRLGVSVLTVPWLLKGFGEVDYGVYILAFGLLASFSFLELGAGKTILRFSSEYRSDKNIEKYNDSLNVGISLITYASVALFIILFGIAILNQKIFVINDSPPFKSFLLFFLAALYGVIVFFQIISANILYGFEKFIERNVLLFFKTIVLIIISYLVFIGYIEVLGYSLLFLLNEVIFLVGDFVLIRREKVIPKMKITLLSISNLKESPVFKYSKDIFFISIISTLSQNVDKFVISLFIDVRFVTIYAIVTKPFFIFKSLLNSLFTALQPILIRQNKEDGAVFKKTVISFIQIPIVLFLPIILYSFFFLDSILLLWLRENYTFSEYLIWGKIALLALIPSLLISVPNRVLMLTGITKPVKKAEYYFTILNILLSVSITYYFKTFGGVIVGTLVQFSLGSVYFIILLNKYFKIRVKDIFQKSILSFITLTFVSFLFASNYLIITSKEVLIITMIISLLFLVIIEIIFLKHLKLLKYII